MRVVGVLTTHRHADHAGALAREGGRRGCGLARPPWLLTAALSVARWQRRAGSPAAGAAGGGRRARGGAGVHHGGGGWGGAGGGWPARALPGHAVPHAWIDFVLRAPRGGGGRGRGAGTSAAPGALLGRHAVCGGVRAQLSGHADADVPLADWRAGRAAARHAGLLRPRVHVVQPAVGCGRGPRKPGRAAQAGVGAAPARAGARHRAVDDRGARGVGGVGGVLCRSLTHTHAQEELEHNLFLRCRDPALQKRVGIAAVPAAASGGDAAAIATLAQLRRLKDTTGTAGKVCLGWSSLGGGGGRLERASSARADPCGCTPPPPPPGRR